MVCVGVFVHLPRSGRYTYVPALSVSWYLHSKLPSMCAEFRLPFLEVSANRRIIRRVIIVSFGGTLAPFRGAVAS